MSDLDDTKVMFVFNVKYGKVLIKFHIEYYYNYLP